MRNKFFAEDQRKTLLFNAWNSFFENSRLQACTKQHFEEFYEGLAHVTDVTKNSMMVRLEEASTVCRFRITEQISDHSKAEDLIYLVAGRLGGKWLPLDIISVGTLIPGKESGFHLTINPLHTPHPPLH